MTPETQRALQWADHAAQWAPLGSAAAERACTDETTPAQWSERRLICEAGRVVRMGVLMPGAEHDLRIPAYMRRGILKQRQQKGSET